MNRSEESSLPGITSVPSISRHEMTVIIGAIATALLLPAAAAGQACQGRYSETLSDEASLSGRGEGPADTESRPSRSG